MPTEPSAAQRIRDSIAALPNVYGPAWLADRHWVCVPTEDGDDPIFGIEVRYGHELAAHVALLASPHVGEALANLLEALETLDSTRVPFTGAMARIAATRDALEAAIKREQT